MKNITLLKQKNSKIFKKLFLMVCVFTFLMSLFVSHTNAASYPEIFPEVYRMYVPQGKIAKLNFTIFHEYKNEEYHVNIYKGNTVDKTKLVSSSSNTLYNYNEYFRDINVLWDTTNVECGKYTVEYYMSFYTLYEWHDEPTKSSLMTIYVYKPGEIANSVLNTDIKAFIDGHPIRSYNIDGYTSIVVEDLQEYGFKVVYDNKERTLKIDDPKSPITSTYKHVQNKNQIGTKAMDVFYTDIITYVKSKDTSGYLNAYGYNADGYTLIRIDDLDEFGTVTWNENARTISFNRFK